MKDDTDRRGFLVRAGRAAAFPLLHRFSPMLPDSPEPGFAFKDSENRSLGVFESGRPVIAYNHGMMLKPGAPEDRRRSCYVHPIHTPDGVDVTDDFPADHLHHRGMSWMWPIVEAEEGKHNLWDIRGIHQKFEAWQLKTAGEDRARIGVMNGWYVGAKKVASERVELSVLRAANHGRCIDLSLTFEASDQPVRLTGEMGPERKGYGGLCLRFAPRTGTIITTSAGRGLKDSNLEPFPWADLSGSFGAAGAAAGAAVFVDRANPGFPNGWTLRNYGFLGVCWPGLQTYTLEPGKPVTLRYRLWAHDGLPEAGVLEDQYRRFMTGGI